MTKDQFDDPLTHKIIHKELGPGFVESIYKRALRIELHKQGLDTKHEKEFKIYYDGEFVGEHHVDLIVERKVIVEAKNVVELAVAHYEQLRSCLRATHLSVGLLVNFSREVAEFRRVEI